MKIYSFILTCLLFVSPPDYSKVFNSDYKDALEFTRQNKELINKACNLHNSDTALITSVLFPEFPCGDRHEISLTNISSHELFQAVPVPLTQMSFRVP